MTEPNQTANIEQVLDALARFVHAREETARAERRHPRECEHFCRREYNNENEARKEAETAVNSYIAGRIHTELETLGLLPAAGA